ncbi:uncharacterized protein LOC128637952 [Bombina bombina]|uniref:uncharacterized protein LOC128637952 n=1 Tax=Bombina bombina TaxID=8345 RepID=UPI00235A8DBB|nr:uncharacterized protein LOC128637952 [Bombina bombina]
MHEPSENANSTIITSPPPPDYIYDQPPPYQDCTLSVIYCPSLSSMEPLTQFPHDPSPLGQTPVDVEGLVPWPANFSPCLTPPDYCELPPPYSSSNPSTDVQAETGELSMDQSLVDRVGECSVQETPFSSSVHSTSEAKTLSPKWFIWSFTSLMLFSPIGIVSVIYLYKTWKSLRMGDTESSRRHKLNMYNYNIMTIAIGIPTDVMLLAAILVPLL